jgi:hypothetical protein
VEGWHRWFSTSMGANSGLHFGDAGSYGLWMTSLREEGSAQAMRRPVAWGGAMMASHQCGGEKSKTAEKEQRRAAKLCEEEKIDWASSRGCDRG